MPKNFLGWLKNFNEQGQFEEVRLLILMFIFFGVIIPLLIRITGDPYGIASITTILVGLLILFIGVSKRGI